MKIEIRYEDLYYILKSAKVQINDWHKEFCQKEDEIYLNKIENILEEIQISPSMIFEISEGAE